MYLYQSYYMQEVQMNQLSSAEQNTSSPQAIPVILEPLLDIKGVKQVYNIKSDTTIYQMIKRGELPAPKKIGPRCSRWVPSEIAAHINAQPRAELPQIKEVEK